MSVYQKPTLVLFSIDGNDFLRRFKNKEFNRPFVRLSSFTKRSSVLSSTTTDKSSGVYRTRCEDKSEKIVATAGHSNFVLFQEGKFDHPPDEPRVCDYCKNVYYGPNFGIPESYEKHRVVNSDGTHSIHVFYVSSFNCSKEHAFGCIEMYTRYWRERDNYIRLFHQMYNLLYPGESLLQPNDPDLLVSRGGCLDQKQWDDKRYLFVKNKVIQVPVKVEYIRKRSRCILTASPEVSESSEDQSSISSSSGSSRKRK